MPAPSIVPNWADGVGAKVTQPTSGKKGKGFTQKEKPPGQYLNWLFNLICAWIAYLANLPRANVWKWTAAIPENITSHPLASVGVTGGGTSNPYVAIAASGILRMRIAPAVGDVITDIGTVGDAVGAGWTIALWKLDLTTPTFPIVSRIDISGGFSGGGVGGYAMNSYTLSAPVTVQDHIFYFLEIANTSGSTAVFVSAVGYKAGTA